MRRRPRPVPPPAPEALARFRITDWYDPASDPDPAPHVRYKSNDDRYAYHFVCAIRRYQRARDEWRSTA